MNTGANSHSLYAPLHAFALKFSNEAIGMAPHLFSSLLSTNDYRKRSHNLFECKFTLQPMSNH